ncbi:MAG: hypothetical protein CMC81_00845 [Flavobacteriaceae bacterium]|nr:hypothetical protein [Flavobacteriaceae bacterium]|tara:strand:+ start:301 stop:1428 length:1128 start_codon:yes stop_codon:yes gene_type:complete
MEQVDYILIGPSYPYRGGIAETQNELAQSLINSGKKVKLYTFKKLYPNFLFPGKDQYIKNKSKPESLNINRFIHSYNPINWFLVSKKINNTNPKVVIFRYYTPFLSICYYNLMIRLNNKIKLVALVDNWIPHEPKSFDKILNKLFSKKINKFLTLSSNVASELKKDNKFPVFSGFHPISKSLPKKLPKSDSRKKLDWDIKSPIVLFYGLIRSYKGLDLLIKSFDEPPLNRSNVKLAIVGEFYEPINKYKKLIAKLKLENRIYIIPKFANEELTQLCFSSADMISLTYKSATQSGVIPLAYHYRTPVLASNLLGLKTPIEKDKTGMICSQNPVDISIKIDKMLNSNEKKFFIKNIGSSIKYYTWNKYSKEIINFIE